MPDLLPILIAAGIGLISGFFLSIPVGPVNLTIMNEGAQRGFRYAILVGFGAATMEMIYCAIAFTGFANFFTHGPVRAAMEVFSFAFMIFIGTKFLMVKSISMNQGTRSRIEKKFDPHSAFMTGFLRSLGNPGLLLFWIALGTNVIFREWVFPTLGTRTACIICVAMGTCLWFATLSYFVAARRTKWSERTLLRMEHASGAGLLVIGIVHGCQIVVEIIRTRHNV